MKCSIPRCPDEAVFLPPIRSPSRPVPPELPLCRRHGIRQRSDFWRHNGKLKRNLGQAQARSWQATWIQMADLELLHSGHGIGVQRGSWRQVDGVDVWVPEGAEPRPSAPPLRPKSSLPEHATRLGQAAIAKRTAEQDLLERRLAVEVEEFRRGQRQVLELELKMKRAVEAKQKEKGKP